MTLDEFWNRFVAGYLVADLESMISFQLPEGRPCGALGYPMVLTSIAGTELLGRLTFSERYQPKFDDGLAFFRFGWSAWLYPNPPERELGEAIYQMLRNGIAHSFATLPRVAVTRLEPQYAALHLRREPHREGLVVDADLLARRTCEAVALVGQTRLKDPAMAARMEQRFRTWLKVIEGKGDNYKADVRRLPEAPYAMPASGQAPSGQINVNSPAPSSGVLPSGISLTRIPADPDLDES